MYDLWKMEERRFQAFWVDGEYLALCVFVYERDRREGRVVYDRKPQAPRLRRLFSACLTPLTTPAVVAFLFTIGVVDACLATAAAVGFFVYHRRGLWVHVLFFMFRYKLA